MTATQTGARTNSWPAVMPSQSPIAGNFCTCIISGSLRSPSLAPLLAMACTRWGMVRQHRQQHGFSSLLPATLRCTWRIWAVPTCGLLTCGLLLPCYCRCWLTAAATSALAWSTAARGQAWWRPCSPTLLTRGCSIRHFRPCGERGQRHDRQPGAYANGYLRSRDIGAALAL